jgi:V8-like Glu-specific endopeptidase
MKRRMTAGLGLIAGLALGLVPAGLATPGAAGAGADRATTPAGSSITRHEAATTKRDQQRIEDYWTPARMKNAIPVGQKVNKGKPGGGGSSGSAVSESPQPQFGKVFFTEGRTNYVCSGTATTSGNGDVVTTAGHCVNEGPGAYVTNFAFYPAYNNGASATYGVWTARLLYTTSQWATSGDYDYDVGFAVMNEKSGTSLTTATGSYAPLWNPQRGQTMKAYGYPAAKPFNGQTLYSCNGVVVQDTYGGSTDQGLACNMTGGSSGGGWIQNGQLASVTSFGYTGVKNILWGPYFGSVIQALYNQAAAA